MEITVLLNQNRVFNASSNDIIKVICYKTKSRNVNPVSIQYLLHTPKKTKNFDVEESWGFFNSLRVKNSLSTVFNFSRFHEHFFF